MKNFIKYILVSILLLTLANIARAEDNSGTGLVESYSGTGIIENQIKNVDYNLDMEKEVEGSITNQVSINTEYSISLNDLAEKLKILNPEKNFRATWRVLGASNQEGFEFKRTFREKGEKEIELTIFESQELTDPNNNKYTEEKVFFSKTFKVLVYEKILPIIFSNSIKKDELDSYIEYSKQDGIYIYKIGPFDKTDIELTNIMTLLSDYNSIQGLKSDYVTIWGSRDFIFDILSKINTELATSPSNLSKLNIVLISPYNMSILENYLKNFLSNKTWIDKIILSNESVKFLILKQVGIDELIKQLAEEKNPYSNIDTKNNGINHLLFISNFINNLSNLGYATDVIYIFLLIPVLFTIISFSKHFIGLSTIGIVIPVFLTEMFFKIGLIETLVLLFVYLIINLLISVITNRYNLLYIPKISFILTINILFFILFFNIAYTFKIIELNLNDVIYFIVFIIISEKFINIILSKDLSEYKESFFYTILISILCYFMLNISVVRIVILAYPELLLLLIPINFMIGKFTGLRVTEYFRFKEVIKNIEE